MFPFRFNSSKPGTQEAGYYKGGVYYLPRRRGGICSGFDVNNARKQQGPTVEDQFKRKLSNHSIIPFKSSLHPPLLPSLPYIPPSSPLLFTIIFLYYIYCRKPRFIIQSGLVHGFRSSLKRFPTQPYSGQENKQVVCGSRYLFNKSMCLYSILLFYDM